MPMSSPTWTRDAILYQLQQAGMAHGGRMTIRQWKDAGLMPPFPLILQHFGRWRAAWEAAGFPFLAASRGNDAASLPQELNPDNLIDVLDFAWTAAYLASVALKNMAQRYRIPLTRVINPVNDSATSLTATPLPPWLSDVPPAIRYMLPIDLLTLPAPTQQWLKAAGITSLYLLSRLSAATLRTIPGFNETMAQDVLAVQANLARLDDPRPFVPAQGQSPQKDRS